MSNEPATTRSLGAQLVELLAIRNGGRTGSGRAAELVEWANRALEAGLDGRQLRILAGMSPPLYPTEVDEVFSQLLAERGLPDPPPNQLFHGGVLAACRSLLEKEISPIQALSSNYQYVIDSGYDDALRAWLELEEDVFLVQAGETPLFYAELRLETIDETILDTAIETLRQLQTGDWVQRYLQM